ncbi:bifunctional diguanylate cyclase/phosphodiesterase [Shewanella sp. MF05960]|uniref:bifunctional diguanylate cyclase/phosphodiesterase n=1 Tax=Shewanella sp. MF05960 TaxID=3434874 RepID=UPI003D7AA85F
MAIAQNQTITSSMGRWMLYAMAALLIFVGVCFLWISSHLINSRFDNFDAKFYEQQLMRVNGVFEQNNQAFESSLIDYAHWNDTEQFVLGNNPTYIEDNYTSEALDNIQVNGFIITHLDGSVVSAPLVTQAENLVPMPEILWAILQPVIPSLMSPTQTTVTSKIIWHNNVGIMISGVAITNTFKNTPSSGYLFFIRILNESFLNGLRELTLVPFKLIKSSSSPQSISSVVRQNNDGDNQWLATKSLIGLAAKTQVQGGTHLQAERDLTFNLLLFSVLGLTLISLIGNYWIVHFKVLNRLRIFSRLADQYRQESHSTIRWLVKGHDELDNLAQSLNEFIAEVEVRHEDLHHLAHHDPLTGIGNRRLLQAKLDIYMHQHELTPHFSSTLLLLDLDGFKLLNDGLGHSAGDHILKLIAQRMTSQVRIDDTVVRLGGDEFAILLEGTDPDGAHLFAEHLLKHIAEPFEYEGHKLNLQASIGLAPLKYALSKEDVIRNADLAMYEAKRRGKNQAVVFKINFLDIVSRRMQLEQALREALNEQELDIWYQPIIDARNGGIIGLEALSRWKLCSEFIPPDEFISIAETSGMITKLGQQVFDKVGAELQALRIDYPELQCNVNLSLRQFRDSDLTKDIMQCIEKYHLPPSALHLELTESMIAESETEILPTMQNLVKHGFKFHLDDFGKGYSSLERLKSLPFDTLKIDRSFVVPLGQNDHVMVKNIINIGHELGMNLIAEGVETEVEVNKLLQLGCHQIQGYYFARPMPLDDLKVWLVDNKIQQLSAHTSIKED